MRVLIVGEGKNDLGYESKGKWHDGPVPIFVKQLLAAVPNLTCECKAWKDLPHHPTTKARQVRGYGGFDGKMRGWMQFAHSGGFNAVVAVADRDGYVQQRRLEKMIDGRDEASRELGIDGAVGLAIEKIEAWLLADEEALRKATGDKSIQRQRAPESLASPDKRCENNAKYRLQQLISNAHPADPTFSKVYADIASAADLVTLAERCPKGFAPFADDVRRLSSKKSPAGK